MFNKVQLTERGKHYFNNEDVKVMYATTDGNFFYERHYADSHAKGLKTDVVTIKRADLGETKKAKEKVEEVKVEETNVSSESTDRYDEYKEATGKKALFHKKETKAYLAWLNDN